MKAAFQQIPLKWNTYKDIVPAIFTNIQLTHYLQNLQMVTSVLTMVGYWEHFSLENAKK